MTKHPIKLVEEAKQEAYKYYDEHIEELPRNPDGSFDKKSGKMSNNNWQMHFGMPMLVVY